LCICTPATPDAHTLALHDALPISGAGMTSDAYHETAPQPEGDAAAQAMRLALAGAGAQAEDVDLVVAHGTGTPLNDAAPASARRSEEHTSELQSHLNLVCRLLLEK